MTHGAERDIRTWQRRNTCRMESVQNREPRNLFPSRSNIEGSAPRTLCRKGHVVCVGGAEEYM